MLKLFLISLQPIALLWLLVGVQFPARSLPQSRPQLAANSTYLCAGDLDKEIEAIISSKEMERSRWGILIQTLNQKRTIYSLDGQKYFLPASNAKLLTTAAALYELGSSFRLRTSVYGSGTLPNLTSLRVVGAADPSLNTAQLKNLASQLKSQGVLRVSQLIVRDNYSQPRGINPTWEWSDLPQHYAVGVNNLILNENAVTLRILPQQLGQPVQLNWSDNLAARQWQIENQALTAPVGSPYSVTIETVFGKPILKIQGNLAIDSQPDIWGIAIVDPRQYFLDSFRRILAYEGIVVDRGVISDPDKPIKLGKELAAVESSPLEILLQKTNRESNNLFAEALAQILSDRLNTETGVDAVKQSLTKLGVDPNSYTLVDASGLSRQNLVSPEAIVQTLQLMASIPEARVYRDSLPVAGVSGTLGERFVNTSLQGELQAKTGSLTGVSALSGYLDPPDYQPLVFSIIINKSDRSASIQRQTIDKIVLLLNSLQSC
ncbi:MAG: D-alanyl-D-alanine carboxypeptidase/D-alanyl-D-alanine-endopeptidase [Prochloraceae cyanobacterium]|nr:D-alanyl-D-alanine carboxypeptidase/D-alanyl-D-alanine-endopeptidase [Prochloraceae cyanobacterium]